jgi:hypothetical protein
VYKYLLYFPIALSSQAPYLTWMQVMPISDLPSPCNSSNGRVHHLSDFTLSSPSYFVLFHTAVYHPKHFPVLVVLFHTVVYPIYVLYRMVIMVTL